MAKYWLILLIIISYYVIDCQNSEDSECNGDLDCPNTICCNENVCVSNEICQWKKITTYAVVAAVGFIFVLITFIYMLFTIKTTKANVSKIKNQVYQEENAAHNHYLIQ